MLETETETSGGERHDMVKLLTTNLLQSHIKGVKNGYPLGLSATEIKETNVDYDPDFLRATFGRVDYGVLKGHADSLGVGAELPGPDQVHEGLLNDEEFLRKLHHALLEVVVVQGELVCPETGRKFPISDCIANLMLHEDEV